MSIYTEEEARKPYWLRKHDMNNAEWLTKEQIEELCRLRMRHKKYGELGAFIDALNEAFPSLIATARAAPELSEELKRAWELIAKAQP